MANRLNPEDRLMPGEALESSDARFHLSMQTDGNFVLYRNDVGALWNSETNGKQVAFAVMQHDGNLVLYAPGGQPLWASDTHGNPGSVLILQDDGNLVIYAPGNKAIWATNTVQPNEQRVIQYQMVTGLAPMHYLATNPDVVKVFGTTAEGAVAHYEQHGKKEGRSPNPFFDPRFYMRTHADLQDAFGAENYERGLQHWIEYGVREGRQGAPAFHLKWYLDHHGDLKQAFGDDHLAALDHWVTHGNREGRLTAPDHILRLISANRENIANVYSASASRNESPDFFRAISASVFDPPDDDDEGLFLPFETTAGRVGFAAGVLIGLYLSGGNPLAAAAAGFMVAAGSDLLYRQVMKTTQITGPAWKGLEHSWIGEELGNAGGLLADGAHHAGGVISDSFKKVFGL